MRYIIRNVVDSYPFLGLWTQSSQVRPQSLLPTATRSGHDRIKRAVTNAARVSWSMCWDGTGRRLTTPPHRTDLTRGPSGTAVVSCVFVKADAGWISASFDQRKETNPPGVPGRACTLRRITPHQRPSSVPQHTTKLGRISASAYRGPGGGLTQTVFSSIMETVQDHSRSV
jgi:hypothetical protein